MAVSRKLISALKRELISRANTELAIPMQAYVKSVMPLYGIKAAPLRQLSRSVFHRYPLHGFINWRDTVLALWREAGYREERYCAIELCEARAYRDYQTLDTLPLYEEMIVTGAWWDLVDPIATHRISHLLSVFPKHMGRVLKQWSRCDDIWKRRSAILSQLRFKENTDLELLYRCIEPSITSGEFFLQKAIGWALRDYAWHDIGEIERYINSHKDRLSPLSRREALKNLHKLKCGHQSK